MIETKKQAKAALIKMCNMINKCCQENKININNSILSFYSIDGVELSVIGGESTDNTVCYFCTDKDNLLDTHSMIKYIKNYNSVNEEKFIEFLNCLWGVVIEEDNNDIAHNIMLWAIQCQS